MCNSYELINPTETSFKQCKPMSVEILLLFLWHTWNKILQHVSGGNSALHAVVDCFPITAHSLISSTLSRNTSTLTTRELYSNSNARLKESTGYRSEHPRTLACISRLPSILFSSLQHGFQGICQFGARDAGKCTLYCAGQNLYTAFMIHALCRLPWRCAVTT